MKKFFKTAGADFSASVVVFLVALPLCLGIALGSNAPLFSGLIAGIVGGIVVGSLSGSHLSVSGPAAGLTAIVAVAIGRLPAYEAFLLAVVIAGIIQIILGYIKAGMLGDYVPTAVIKGMLSSIGIILILKQIPHLIGYDAEFPGNESFKSKDLNTFTAIIAAVKYPTMLAVIIGGASLLLQIIWDNYLVKLGKLFKQIPSPLVVVIVAVALSEWLTGSGMFPAFQPEHLVSIPVANDTKSFFSFFTNPDFSYITNPIVWTSAFTLAIVASLETLLNVEAADQLDPYQRFTPTNRELKAQGAGNLVSGLIGGLPITSVIVRTSANVNAGARTKMSAIMHGVLLLLCVAFIPAILNRIPLSALAAVLIYTGFKLAKPSIFIKLYKKGWDQFLPYIITILAILFTDLLVGILIGIAVGLFFVLQSNFKSAVLVVNDENRFLVRLRKDVSFLNKPILKEKLENIPPDAFVIIDASRADFIDKDIIEVINEFMQHAHLENIKVTLKKNANNQLHQLLRNTQFEEAA